MDFKHELNLNLMKVTLITSKLKYPRLHPYCFLFYMYLIYSKIVKRRSVYTIKPVSFTLMKNYVRSISRTYLDINNSVVINENMVYKTDLLLKLICSNELQRIVHVVPSQSLGPSEILMSDTLFNNINVNNLNNIHVKLQTVHEQNVIFADEVEISLINCPNDIGNSIIDAVLQKYFELPKLLYENDVIEVNINDFGNEIFYLNMKINNVKNIYFKCIKIVVSNKETEGGVYCAVGQTNLKQSSNIQSFIPKQLYMCCNEIVYNDVLMCPYGFEDNFREIENAAKPFILKKKLKLKPIFLIKGKKGSGKDLLLSSLAAKFGVHYYKITNLDVSANVYAQNEIKLRNVFFTAKMGAPCFLVIHNFEHFGKNNEGQYDQRIMGYFAAELNNLFENNSYPVLLFCCSNEKEIPAEMNRLFLETFEINYPNDKEREQNLKWILETGNISTTANLAHVANKTHGFLFEDLKALVYYANRDCISQSLESVLNEDHFNKALDFMQSNYNESLGAPKVPKVQWTDVGGLGDVKDEIIKTINLPLKHPELLKTSGLKRSGILLFGPPGTGKTLIAKAVATECSLCFLSVKGPELLNMYVGQSEQNVREVFERARQAAPCIIFFDELDSLAPNRGLSGDSGGVMDRVVSQLLAEMDGLNESATIFIIGATNRPDLIDPALLRPGRFDKLLYVGPCTDKDSKISVLKALTRKFKLAKDVNLEDVVDICPENITGADFYGICSNSWTSAVRKLVLDIEAGLIENPQNLSHENVEVTLEDFRGAIKNVRPSISHEDLKYFEKLKKELSANSSSLF